MVEAIMTREPEFDQEQVDLLLAHEAIERSLGSHGIPYADATDEANARKFITTPVVDWAAKSLHEDQEAFFKSLDTDKEHPIDRGQFIWSVRLPKE